MYSFINVFMFVLSYFPSWLSFYGAHRPTVYCLLSGHDDHYDVCCNAICWSSDVLLVTVIVMEVVSVDLEPGVVVDMVNSIYHSVFPSFFLSSVLMQSLFVAVMVNLFPPTLVLSLLRLLEIYSGSLPIPAIFSSSLIPTLIPNIPSITIILSRVMSWFHWILSFFQSSLF